MVRCVLESLALKYRYTLDALECVTGTRCEEVRIVGGGARNTLLNEFTAEATGRRVIAGPVEATALGNIAMQLLATGSVASLSEARRLIDRSIPTRTFDPVIRALAARLRKVSPILRSRVTGGNHVDAF